ncbi:MAG: hypothetical protein BroJett040_25380 [Oligoflexia bacterium]|nr:MAG: hypothetical protein BroJett040_25380 [Oligoflexia bacterium]
MIFQKQIFIISTILFFGVHVIADSASQILLKKGSTQPSSSVGLQSGRYQVKTSSAPAVTEGDEDPVPMPESLKKKKNKKPKKAPASEAAPVAARPEPAKAIEIKESQTEKDTKDEASFSDQMKSLIDGDRSQIEAYKEQVHSDDVRLNRVEIEVTPGVMYNASRASMSYRNYQQFAPTLGFGAELWLTPLFGIRGKVTNTMGSDVSSNASTTNRVPAKNEWSDLALDFRKYFGLSRKSNSLTFGLHYSNYQFLVPSDELTRIRTRSSGFGVHLVGRLPTAPSYTWVFGGFVQPRLTHVEASTGLNLQSGTGQESSKIGISLGGEFKMSRQHQIIWELGTQFERNQFNGSSNIVDTETGVVAQSVSVTNSWSFFSLGYRWGR